MPGEGNGVDAGGGTAAVGENLPMVANAFGVDGDRDALTAEMGREFGDERRPGDSGRIDRDLVRPGVQQGADIRQGANPPADR